MALSGLTAAWISTWVLSWNDVFAASILTLRNRTLPAHILNGLSVSPLFLQVAVRRDGHSLEAAIERAGAVTVDDGHREQLGRPCQQGRGWAYAPRTSRSRATNGIAADQLRGKVLVVQPLGSHDSLTVRLGPELIKGSIRPDMNVQVDEDIGMRLEHGCLSWLDAETGRTIGV